MTISIRSMQELLAFASESRVVRRYYFVDGVHVYTAVAPNLGAAREVIMAEHPNTKAEWNGTTQVPCMREVTRRAAKVALEQLSEEVEA